MARDKSDHQVIQYFLSRDIDISFGPYYVTSGLVFLSTDRVTS